MLVNIIIAVYVVLIIIATGLSFICIGKERPPITLKSAILDAVLVLMFVVALYLKIGSSLWFIFRNKLKKV